MRYVTGTFDVIIGNGGTSFCHTEFHTAGQTGLKPGDIGFYNICSRFLHEQTVVVITNEGGCSVNCWPKFMLRLFDAS